MYSFTNDTLRDAVLAAYENGVKVRVISDDLQAKGKGSDIQTLAEAGIPCVTDRSTAAMHNKYCIVDSAQVITGSFNWSKNAETKNQENLVILSDPKVISEFASNFEELWVKFAGNLI